MTQEEIAKLFENAPEGATHYLPEVPERGYCACWYKQDSIGRWLGSNAGNYAKTGDEPWSVDDSEVEVFTRYLIKRHTQQWNGEGLPPVGTVCEVFNNDLSNPEWEKCTILFSGKHRVLYDSESCCERVGYIDCLKFRPVRTPEQIAAERREAAIKAMCELGVDAGDYTIEKTCEALYDHGCRLPEGGDK